MDRTLIDIGYVGVTALGVVTVFPLVLYFFDDWVLLTLSLLFLLGLIWTSRTMFPRVGSEVMLLLNLGTVREGERVLYQGVPWQVATLHFYTRLVNPALEGGDLRLTLSDCLALRSRASTPDEPWFPTQKGGWVLLGEQTLGQVVLQTPENVRVRFLDGSQRTFRTPDFLTQPLTVLTNGFGIHIRFGLDRQHHDRITREIPAQLEGWLQAALEREGHTDDIQGLTVEFEEAGATTFTLSVFVTCVGTAASRLPALRRAIQRLCVEACADYGWALTFSRLTVSLIPASPSTPGEPDGAPAAAH